MFSLLMYVLLLQPPVPKEALPPPNAETVKPHLPNPPTPNCQCGCTKTGQCTCKDCDHPALTSPKESSSKPAQTQPVDRTAPAPATTCAACGASANESALPMNAVTERVRFRERGARRGFFRGRRCGAGWCG